MKQFKLAVSKQHATITNVEICDQTKSYSVVLERFTASTFILLVFVAKPYIHPAAVACNLSVARKMFQKIGEDSSKK